LTIEQEDTLRLIWFKIIGQVFWNTLPHYSYFLTLSISGETTFPNSNKRKRFSKIFFNLNNKTSCKTSKMRVAIPKLYFPIDPKITWRSTWSTLRRWQHTLSMLEREQKINNYLKTFANQLGGDTLAFYPKDKYTNGLMEKVIHTFRNIMEILKLGLSSVTEWDWKTEDTSTVTILLMIS